MTSEEMTLEERVQRLEEIVQALREDIERLENRPSDDVQKLKEVMKLVGK